MVPDHRPTGRGARPPSWAAAILAATAALAFAAAGQQPEGEGAAPLALQALWRGSAMQDEVPVEAFDTYGVAFEDILGTGRPVMISLNDNGRLYVVDAHTGHVVQEVDLEYPGGTATWHTRTLNGVAVGDLDGDGRHDVVALNTGGMLTRLEVEGGALAHRWSVLAHAPAFDDTFWQRHPWLTPREPQQMSHLAHGAAYLARPAAGAPSQWVYVHSDDLPGAFAFDADGALQWLSDWHDGHAGPWVGDLVPGEARSAVFATDAGMVVGRDAATGAVAWTYSMPADVRPGSFSAPPGVADVDGDGRAELLVVGRVAVEDPDDAQWMQRQHAAIAMLGADGHERWRVHHPQGNPMAHGRAFTHDVDGDGVQDWILVDWNTIGRKPGAWERLGPGNLFALSGRDGALLWSAPVDAPATDFDAAAARFDGQPMAVVPHAQGGRHGVATVSLADGRHTSWVALPEGWEPVRGPSLVDLDGDGLLEAVQRVARPGGSCQPKQDIGCREGGIAVLRTTAPADGAIAAGHGSQSADPLPRPPTDAAAPHASADVSRDAPPAPLGDPADRAAEPDDPAGVGVVRILGGLLGALGGAAALFLVLRD